MAHPRRSVLGIALLIGAAVGAVVGYVLARAFPEAHGAAHKCPAGAAPNSCFYPADHGLHQALFAVGGAVVAALIVVIVWRQLLDDPW